MKKFFCVLLLLSLLFNTQSFSQSVRDYIITNTQDTIYGKIIRPTNYFKQVKFRASTNEDYKTYFTEDLVGYNFRGQPYKALEVNITSGEQEKIFLITLAQGTVNLYFYQYRKIFYIEKDNTIYPLVRNDQYINGAFEEDRKFVNILKVFFSDCENLLTESQYRKVDFTEKSLTNITNLYNRCRDKNYVAIENNKPKTRNLKFGAAVGISPFNPNFGSLQNSIETSTQNLPVVLGLTLSAGSPFLSNLKFQGGIFMSRRSATVTTVNNFFTEIIEVDYNYLHFNAESVFIIPGEKITPGITGGISFNTTFGNSFKLTELFINGPLNERIESNTTSGSQSFTFPIGIVLNYSLSPKHEMYLDYQYEKTKRAFTSHQILIGIRI